MDEKNLAATGKQTKQEPLPLRFIFKDKKITVSQETVIWWAGVDSDHRSQVTTDLQSVPFGRSGTYPYILELAIGIEPTTC